MSNNVPNEDDGNAFSLKWTKANIALAIVMLTAGLVLGYLVAHFITQGSGPLSETTIIAIVFFAFLALLTGFAMFSTSEAVANAIKMLTSLSAIFGVVIGAIPGFYFANKVNQSEIKQAKQETNVVEEGKQKAVNAANTAGTLANELATAISNVNGNRTVTIESNKIKDFANKISKIQEVTNRVAQDAKAGANN
jgi:ABC-type multidrug transport system permease subunit